jgi:hypothetical protein
MRMARNLAALKQRLRAHRIPSVYRPANISQNAPRSNNSSRIFGPRCALEFECCSCHDFADEKL